MEAGTDKVELQGLDTGESPKIFSAWRGFRGSRVGRGSREHEKRRVGGEGNFVVLGPRAAR